MGKAKRKGFFVELPEDLIEEWRAFCDSFPIGNTTQHIAWAMRRHMKSPPEIMEQDLPKPAGPLPPGRPRGRPKKPQK